MSFKLKLESDVLPDAQLEALSEILEGLNYPKGKMLLEIINRLEDRVILKDLQVDEKLRELSFIYEELNGLKEKLQGIELESLEPPTDGLLFRVVSR